MSHVLADTDRRAPLRTDRAEALRQHFHADERARLMDQLDEWLAELQAEAPSPGVTPADESAFWRDMA